jgi:hypothetical protein
MAGHKSIVEMLLEAGANQAVSARNRLHLNLDEAHPNWEGYGDTCAPTLKPCYYMWTPLGVAIRTRQTELAKLLIEAGSSTTNMTRRVLDPQLNRVSYQMSAMHLAASMGNLDLMDYLVK